MHNWQILNNYKYDPQKKDSLSNLILNLLKNRGIKSRKETASFLNPSLASITLDSLGININSVKKAALRIRNAVKNKEKITIYTDYDADGILSGAILWETLYSLNANCLPFVPNRLTEGYGLSKTGIDKVKSEQNPDLIITVDHGVSKIAEVEYAKKMGIEVIIIDHHLPAKILPKAVSIIHTTILCATGLTWVFANFLKGQMQQDFLDLVALATVADMMPLTGANRALVKYGLDQINKTGRLGLKVLLNNSGLKKGEIDSYSLSHVLAPRLNASGRLTNALDSLRLICTKDRVRAHSLAEQLNSVNRNRQNLTRESFEIAVSQVSPAAKFIIAGHESFHQGVIGLIAGKLAETYHRPAIVISIGQEICKASARSVKGINIVEFLHSASELLIDVGGHPMAAGFTVNKKNLQKLKQKLLSNADKLIGSIPHVPVSLADLELDPALVDDKLFAEISALATFGQANPKPAFAAFALKVRQARVLGRDKNHLKLELSSKNNPEKIISAIAFNFGNLFSSLGFDSLLDMIYEIDKDNWNGQSGLILKLRDVRLAA